jgi:hypothetical protein
MSAATFPLHVRSFSPKVDLVDYILADHINSLQNEVVAIESTLGDNDGVRTSDYSPSRQFVRTTNWTTLTARLLNLEAGLINGVANSPYVQVTGGSSIQPATGVLGLTLQRTSSDTTNLLEARPNSGTPLNFNLDYNGIPKVGTANVLYVGSSDYNNLVSGIAAAVTTIHPFLLGGL